MSDVNFRRFFFGIAIESTLPYFCASFLFGVWNPTLIANLYVCMQCFLDCVCFQGKTLHSHVCGPDLAFRCLNPKSEYLLQICPLHDKKQGHRGIGAEGQRGIGAQWGTSKNTAGKPVLRAPERRQ